MKRYIITTSWLVALAILVSSCNKFLEENPKTFLSPKDYFKSEAQITAAVNGLYSFVDDIFDGDIEVGSQTYIFMDYLPGYGYRPRGAGTTDIAQGINLNVAENNGYLEKIWKTAYTAIENCNSTLEGFEPIVVAMDGTEALEPIISRAKGRKLLGEVYFMRAYFYFNLVRLFGEVPLKLTSTKDISNIAVPLSSQDDVYARIEADLEKAEQWMEKAGAPWSSVDGRVTKATVKSIMAKVYLTMAGYPMQKGTEYYRNAYEKAKEVYLSGEFYLFDTYADLRDPSNENSGEYMWMIQRESAEAGSGVHNAMLPYPEPPKAISANSTAGGAMAPTQEFCDSYESGDLRVEEKGFFFTEHETPDNSEVIPLGGTFIYKYWDGAAAVSGKSGANYPLLRYADVLLIMAEAKAMADGGTTSDADAVEGYYMVRNRALPAMSKPTSVAVNDILKERFWEFCFEYQTWFDMLRTRKALNVTSKQIVDMINYQTPGHPEGHKFEMADLLFPYPLREVRLNPNLKRE